MAFDYLIWYEIIRGKDELLFELMEKESICFSNKLLEIGIRYLKTKNVKSPIEKRLFFYLLMLIEEDENYDFFIFPQYEIEYQPNKKYRVDFLIGKVYPVPEVSLIIECDGHEFHEKTKEQSAKDKKRDRDLTKMGYTILRFTGSEIHNNPAKCVSDIKEVLMRLEG